MLHGLSAVNETVNPDGDAVALTGTGALPYCTFANCGKLIVCATTVEVAETIANVPETGSAALYAGGTNGTAVLSPACEAVIVQVPVPFSVTVADDFPVLKFNVEAPAEHGPVAAKLTSCLLAVPFESAVAETVSVAVDIDTELGKGSSWIV